MKKLLLVLFVASFVGLAFAFSPARIVSSPGLNGTVLMDDTTKTTTKKATAKKDATKKMDCSSKSCCKSHCSEKKTTKKKEDN